MAERRPIDTLRDSAKSGQIGSDGDDSAITDMIPIGDVMYFVKEQGIYAMQLADQIDPNRTNAAIPDTQQRVLAIGSTDPIVARTLLTAHALFDDKFLGPSFERAKGLRLALELLKDIAALEEMRTSLQSAELDARAPSEGQGQANRPFTLPVVVNLEARCDAFAQKAAHVVNTLEQVAKLFYADELKSKWIDSLMRIAAQRCGDDSPFAQYMTAIRPFLLFVLDMRNMIEHPTEAKYIKISNFRLLASGTIELPYVEVVRPGGQAQKATITLLMKQIIDDLVSAAEGMIACLCAVNVHPLAGMPVQVVELPPEQKPNKHQRFFYGTFFGGQIVRIG
jgi:hypothetical protein